MVTDDPEPTPFRSETYGESFADVYDDWYRDVTDAEATARFVAARAGGRPVLELGVGTGRLARPLLDRGVTVVGVDVSASMLARCRGASDRSPAALHLVRADMTALPIRAPGRGFGAVLIGFNTLFNVDNEPGQRTVFEQVASLVTSDGVIVVETSDLALDGAAGSSVEVGRRHRSGLTVVACTVDPAAQTIAGQHVDIGDHGVRKRPWRVRWSTPDQLDRYAAAAGLGLVERYADWEERPITPAIDATISVYRRRR